jgi:hypothetical protein
MNTKVTGYLTCGHSLLYYQIYSISFELTTEISPFFLFPHKPLLLNITTLQCVHEFGGSPPNIFGFNKIEDYESMRIINGDTDNVRDMAEVKDWALSVGRNNLSNQCQHPHK